MPFTLTKMSRAPGWTRADLLADIATMADGFGWTLHDSYNSAGNEIRVYRYAVNGTAKGTTYMLISVPATIASGTITTAAYDTWNTGTHTGTTQVSSMAITLVPASQLNMFGFNSSNGEGQFIVFDADHGRYCYGWIRPQTKHPAYDEATYRFIFSPITGVMNTAIASAGLEGSNAYAMSSTITSVSGATYDGGYRQVAACKWLYRNSSTCGVIGWFSDDWVEISSSGLQFGDIVRDEATKTNRYFVLVTSGGNLALRLA